METGELINILAQAPQPKRPWRFGLCAMLAMLLSASATLAIIGVRPELAQGQMPLSFLMKTSLLLIMAVISLRALSAASVPLTPSVSKAPEILAAAVMTMLVAHELFTDGPVRVGSYFLLANFPSCLFFVTLYGLLGLGGFAFLARQYAPANALRYAGLVGLASAASGAVGYSIHCPLDSPSFILVAYGVPMTGLWFVARRVLPRQLKW
jgi:hypothetical protein